MSKKSPFVLPCPFIGGVDFVVVVVVVVVVIVVVVVDFWLKHARPDPAKSRRIIIEEI